MGVSTPLNAADINAALGSGGAVLKDNGAAGVGTFAMMIQGASTCGIGATTAGSNLQFLCVTGALTTFSAGATAAGTWRNMSGITATTGNAYPFQRVA